MLLQGIKDFMSRHNINTLYLIRHGENLANVTREFSYKLIDYSLTDKGILQAQQTAEYFKGKHIDEIYSSPLKRAQETAEVIARPLHLKVTNIEAFREVNVGILEGQPPSAENWELHNRIVNDWYSGLHTSIFPDGEDFLMLTQRMRAGLWQITHDQSQQHIIVVGHGGIFTAAVTSICSNADPEIVTLRSIHNCSITEIELTTSDNDVTGILKRWADSTHLVGEATQFVPGVPSFEEELLR